MNDENVNSAKKATSLHEVGRTTEGQTLDRPTAVGWWWVRQRSYGDWEPCWVSDIPNDRIGEFASTFGNEDIRASQVGRWEWAGPLMPPRGPTKVIAESHVI